MSKRLLHTIVALILFVLSLGFHSQHLDFASYELDEAVHLWFAQMPYETVIEKAADDPNPPVYNLIISSWVKQFGVHEASTRLFSAIVGSLAVVMMFLFGARNFGFRVGLFAALFFCLSPVQYRFTHMARPYALLMFAVVLSYGFLLEWYRKPRKFRDGFFYYLATSLMIYVHPTSVFNIPAQGLILLFGSKRSVKNLVVSVIPLASALLTYLIWFMVIPYFERSHQMWFQPPSWSDIEYVLGVFYGNSYVLFVQVFALLLILFRRKKIDWTKSKLWLVSIWAIIPFVSSIGFSYLIKPIFQDKYILTVQPGMMLLLALSIEYSLGNWKLVKTTASLGVLILLGTSILFKPPPFGGDWKGAVSYIQSGIEEEVAVIIEPEYEYRTFAYYFDKSIYENYDSTINLLGTKDVFTSWTNIYNEQFKWPNYKYVYAIHSFAHQTLADLNLTKEYLDSVGYCIDIKTLDAIKVRKYKFKNPISYNGNRVVDSFENASNGVFSFSPKVDYSSSIQLPLFILDQDSLSVTCSVDVKSEEQIKDAQFLITIESEDDFLLYDVWSINELLEVDSGWQTISKSLVNKPISTDATLKIFVANPKGESFEIDNLTVVFED